MTRNRRSVRLKEYDYAQAGAYFVTTCTRNRECLLGEIVGCPAVQARPRSDGICYVLAFERPSGIVAPSDLLKSAAKRGEGHVKKGRLLQHNHVTCLGDFY